MCFADAHLYLGVLCLDVPGAVRGQAKLCHEGPELSEVLGVFILYEGVEVVSPHRDL